MNTLLDLLMQRNLSPTKSNSAASSALGINPGEIAGMPVGGGGTVASVMGAKTAPKVAGTAPKTGMAALSEKLGAALGDPLMQFGLSMLANSAPTTAPNSFGGALGKSGLQVLQQQQGQKMNDLQRRLMEAQIKNSGAKQEDKKPLTEIAKLREDFVNGNISQDAYEQQRRLILSAGAKDDQERTQSLRGEFRKDTDTLRTGLGDLSKAKALIASDNPIAATAAFTSFIRSIDNSVVRPAEQAAYSSAGGAARRLQDELTKLQGKGAFGEETRADLLAAINAIESELSGIMDRTVSYYNDEAGVYGLRPQGVTGLPSSERRTVELPVSDKTAPPANTAITEEDQRNARPFT